jgi:hypothetical protein
MILLEYIITVNLKKKSVKYHESKSCISLAGQSLLGIYAPSPVPHSQNMYEERNPSQGVKRNKKTTPSRNQEAHRNKAIPKPKQFQGPKVVKQRRR